jgi:hypothetical protein
MIRLDFGLIIMEAEQDMNDNERLEENQENTSQFENSPLPDHQFFFAFRKYGFYETMALLSQFPEGKAAQQTFHSKIIEDKGSLNSMYRCHDSLLKFKLITYELDDHFDKVLVLTEKGKTLLTMIQEVDELLGKPKPKKNKRK